MIENSITTRLIDCIKKLSDAAIDRLLTLALSMIDAEAVSINMYPYCGSTHIVRNVKKCGKQRFLCRSCGRTFVTTTHTLLSMSHPPASIWKELISHTLRGDAIDYTADCLGLSHTSIFLMRHKFLLALQIWLPRILSSLSRFKNWTRPLSWSVSKASNYLKDSVVSNLCSKLFCPSTA